jgi:hypothetical protein
VQWGVRYVGYPYIWGGEWGLKTAEPSALGGQTRPGFDCSGLAWWLMRKNDDYAWKVAPPRPYAAWSLPQRTTGDMYVMNAETIDPTENEETEHGKGTCRNEKGGQLHRADRPSAWLFSGPNLSLEP